MLSHGNHFGLMKLHGEIIAQSGGDVWTPAPVPETNSLAKVAAAAKECTACPLHKKATQTVFGEGPKKATMLMIGEQPGDCEDVAGKPFVGPARKILDRALDEAGIARDEVYVTNAVKHFKWEPRGKRRIHQKPSCVWLSRSSLSVSGPPPVKRSLGQVFASPSNVGKFCRRVLRRRSWQPFIPLPFCVSPTKSRANVNTTILSRTCASR